MSSTESKLFELEKKLSENLYNKQLLVEIIEFLSSSKVIEKQDGNDDDDNGDKNHSTDLKNLIIEKLEVYRTRYTEQFLPDYSFWQSWIIDFISASSASTSSSTSVTNTFQLFEKALFYCPKAELVLDYLDYCASLSEEEKIDEDKYRKCFEYAISIGGIDIYTGGMIWKRYREFEVDEHEDLIETGTENIVEITTSKKRIISLFHRQLSLPLVGNDRVLKEMDQILSQICDESDLSLIQPEKLQKLFEISKKELQARLVFEDYILSGSFDLLEVNQRYKSWKAYITLEMNEHKLSRVQRLFERAVLNCSDHIELWKEYLQFAIEIVKNWSLVCDITFRLIKILNQDMEVWQSRFFALENMSQETELLTAFSQAMISSYSSVEDYLSILFFKSSYYRRKAQKLFHDVNDSTSLIELSHTIQYLRSSNEELEIFLETYYDSWIDGWIRVYKYEVGIEDELIELIGDRHSTLPTKNQMTEEMNQIEIKSMSKDIWERAIKRFGKYYVIWKEYILWSRFHQEIEFTRKLYRRMITSVTDYLELGYQEWLQFEYQCGSLLDIQVAIMKSKAFTKKIQQKIENQMEKEDRKSSSSASSSSSTAQKKRPREEEEEKKSKQGSQVLDKRSRQTETLQSSESHHRNHPEDEDNHSVPSEPSNHQNITTTATTTTTTATNLSNASVRIIVKSLSFHSTEETIRSHFSSCGPIKSLEIILSKSGKSRGIANIIFENESSVEAALKLHQSTLDNRSIIVERWTSDALGLSKLSSNINHDNDTLTIFVNKFSLNTTEIELKNLFEANVGGVLDIKLALDKETHKRKGTALIEFSTIENRNKAIQMNKQLVDKDGNFLTILPSKFKISKPHDIQTIKSSENSGDSRNDQNQDHPNRSNPYLADNKEKNETSLPTIRIGQGSLTSSSSSALTFKPRGLIAFKK